MMDTEDVFDKLTQEERLKLLEQLIKGASQAQEESLTIEQRVKRLEEMLGAGSKQARVKAIRLGGCSCC
jgi:cell division septum initiation protein DivIVA